MKLRIQRMIIGIAVLPLALIALLFIYIVLSRIAFSILGYPIDIAPDVLATKIVREKLKSDLCNKLRQSLPSMGPSVVEKRQMCIAGVASLAKDPSACELLMPSSYGLSCVSSATRFLPCFFSDKKTVVWSEGNLEKDRREFPFESCSSHTTSSLGEACCITAQSRFIPEFTNCASLKLSDPLMLDQCEYEVALKNLSPDTCSTIKDLNLQSACMVQVNALNKYPELRENYPFINK